ncbi:MAG: hypothetical protein ACK417_10675 [Bacteroidia bacterium]
MAEGALIKYGNFPPDAALWRQWLQPLGMKAYLINNQTSALMAEEIAGDNSQYEFSGYRKACELFESDGPFLIANDTLFKTHDQKSWQALIRSFLAKMPADELAVWGDIRSDGNALLERPDPFLASWIFILPNRRALELFRSCLQQLLDTERQADSREYAEFLDAWVNQRKLFGGWHGLRNEENISRKKHCIRLEHALSRALAANELPLRSLGAYFPVRYRLLRWRDRLRTRLSILKISKG